MSDLHDAIQQVCDEKNISIDSVLETIDAALAAAYRKDFGQKNQNIKVNFDLDTNKMDVFDIKTVVEDMDLEELEKEREEFIAKKEAGEEVDEESLRKFNPKTEIMLTEAKELDKKAKVGQEIKTKLEIPDEFGRMAAQTAKQVIIQRLREAEREVVFEEFQDKTGTIVTGTIQRREGRMVYIDVGHALAILPPDEQIYSENYSTGQRYKFYVASVEKTVKGPEIKLSRTHPDLIRELFKMEVPEIDSGDVEIKAVAREAGARSKIAVISHEDNIDPVGSCVGQRGTRVQTIISELGGEKIDIIEWSKDPQKFIANALSPAKVDSLELNEKEKIATVKVKEDQLSLAIGKDGQNVRLAAKLTEWKIDIAGAGVVKEAGEETEGEAESKEESTEASEETDNKGKVKAIKEEFAKEVKEEKVEEAKEESKKEDK